MNWIQKFTSRKFLVALVAILSGLGLITQVLGTPQVDAWIEMVLGAVLVLGAALGYDLAEAIVDAAAIKKKTGESGADPPDGT